MEWEWTDSDVYMWTLCHKSGGHRLATCDDEYMHVDSDGLSAEVLGMSPADALALLTWVSGGALPDGAVRVGEGGAA